MLVEANLDPKEIERAKAGQVRVIPVAKQPDNICVCIVAGRLSQWYS